MQIETILPADREEWKRIRGQDITASVAAGLLDIHPYATPYQLWAQKTGRMNRHEKETAAMRRGTLLEPVAVKVLEEIRPDWRIEYRDDRAYYRAPVERVGATPDVFALRPDIEGAGIVQIKTVSHEALRSEWMDPDTGDIVPPLWIAVQTIIEAILTKAQWCAVGALVWNRDALDLELIDIPIKRNIWNAVAKKTAEFWAMIDAGEEPDPEWARDGKAVLSVFGDSVADRVDLSDLGGIDSVIERYEAAGRAKREAEKIRATLKPQLIYALGNSEAGVTSRYRLSAPTVRKDAHEVSATTYRSLRIKERNDR